MRCWICYSIVSTIFVTVLKSEENEKKLYDLLLADYNILVRPVENNTDPVNVTLGLTFQQLVDVVSYCKFY